MRARLREGLRAAFPTVSALVGSIRRIFGPDPLRPLSASAALLSVLVGAAFGNYMGWDFSLGTPHIPFYLTPIFGLVGLAVAWTGWRFLGGAVMALTAIVYAYCFLVTLLFLVILFAPFFALASALWMGAAISAWSAVPSNEQRA
jgi:hypothetical protein